jgi:hypothetical protein
LDERRARNLPYKHLSIHALPDYQGATNVSVEFGATNRESGLYVIEQADSKHVPTAVHGEEAWFFKPGWNYSYFFIDPTFKWALGSNVVVRVEYQVVRGNPIGLHYDGERGAYSFADERVSKQPTGKWQAVEFRLRDARFRNSQNGGADFRIWDNERGFYVRRVTVWRYERQLPPRDPSLGSNLIDLTRFYHSTLRHYVPGGDLDRITNLVDAIRRNTGVSFDARGYIGVYQRGEGSGNQSPVSVNGIPIRRRVSRLHFLHAADYWEDDGTKIGFCLMEMSDGSHQELPIIYGQNVRSERGDSKTTPDAEVAWEGEGIRTGAGTRVRIFKTTWINPRPDLEIKSLDFISTKTRSAPRLLAITAE